MVTAADSTEITFTKPAKVGKFRRPEPPKFQSLAEEAVYRKRRLVDTCRILCNEGWGIGCAAHLSIRDAEDLDTTWMVPSGKPLLTIQVDDLIAFNLKEDLLTKVSTQCYDLNQVAIHLAIYQDRPDVGAIIHGHTPNAKAFSIQGKTISMICQDSCTFYQRIHVLPFHLSTTALSNPKGISKTLTSTGKGFIMSNRGLLTVGQSIECALSYFIRMENLCKAQMLAEAAVRGRGGSIQLVGEEEVAFTFENTGSEHHAWLMAMPYYARVDRQNLLKSQKLVA